MTSKTKYIPRDKRKKILLLCDDLRMHSGIATMAREIVIKSAHHFNWFNVGAAVNHPDAGKILDISGDVNKHAKIEDSYVKVMPNNGYGDAQLVRSVIKQENIDGVFIFTDPRYWGWLFEIEREIRSKIPIFYYNIWDDYPAPLYNKSYYESVDVLMAISKQTKNINKLVLGEAAKDKVINYVPHGINPDIFYPITEEHESYDEFLKFRKELFQEKEIEFVVFFNSRNIQRKRPGDVVLAYKVFCDMIGEDKAKKCALVMHTSQSDKHGTDLKAVKDALFAPNSTNVFFSQNKLSPQQMNLLYNVADVTTLISSNEGWGLSLTESMMAGTMIVGNVTGGMQDQMRFVDGDLNWIDFSADFPSNHRGTYKNCGSWVEPVFPSNISLAGSVPTPYIFDDRCDPIDAGKAIFKIYNLKKEERDKRGAAGRNWAMSEEAKFTSQAMADGLVESMNEGMKKFTPRPKYDVFKVEKPLEKLIKHNLYNY